MDENEIMTNENTELAPVEDNYSPAEAPAEDQGKVSPLACVTVFGLGVVGGVALKKHVIDPAWAKVKTWRANRKAAKAEKNVVADVEGEVVETEEAQPEEKSDEKKAKK